MNVANRTLSMILLAAFLTIATLPFFASAQATSTTELSATIRSALLSDPRTSGLPQAQIDAMVDVLTQEAQKQGMTVHDITWRPQSTKAPVVVAPTQQAVVETCGNFLCSLSEAFGFTGPAFGIPYVLGASSMLLVWILAEMLHRHRMKMLPVPIAPSVAPPPSPPASPPAL